MSMEVFVFHLVSFIPIVFPATNAPNLMGKMRKAGVRRDFKKRFFFKKVFSRKDIQCSIIDLEMFEMASSTVY